MALTTAFARNGNRKAVPQSTADGSVSYEQGFGNLYALPPEEGGLFIDRAQFNQIMYDTTSAVISNQNSINTLNGKVANIESSVSTGVVNLTGNQTIAGVKTFSSPPISATNPTANNQVANKAYVDTVGNTAVKLTGNQTIAGIKTFSSPVVVPNGTANTHAVNLAQLNTKANANATVNLTGDQNIAGIKAFTNNITAPNIKQMQNSINALETKASTSVQYLTRYINWNIGPGGDYETIADALASAREYNSRSRDYINLNLNANYPGGEDLSAFNGDFGNVIINGGENRFHFNTFFVKMHFLTIRFVNINIINASGNVFDIHYCPQIRIDNLSINAGAGVPLNVLGSRVFIVGNTCTLTTTGKNAIATQTSILNIRAESTLSSSAENIKLDLGSIVSSKSPATANIAKNTPTANGLFLN